MNSLFRLEVPEVIDETSKIDKIIIDKYYNNLNSNINIDYLFAESKEKLINKEIFDINDFNSDVNFFLLVDNFLFNRDRASTQLYFSRSVPSNSFPFTLLNNIYSNTVNTVYKVFDKITESLTWKIVKPVPVVKPLESVFNEEDRLNQEVVVQKYNLLLKVGILGDQLCISLKSGKLLILNIKNKSKTNITLITYINTIILLILLSHTNIYLLYFRIFSLLNY